MNYQNELKAISLPNEQWAQVPNEPLYYASSEGRVVCFRFDKCKVLKQSVDRCGYLQVHINSKTQSAHRLVIHAFNGSSDLKTDHINAVKTDNRLVNLEYVSNRENLTRHYILNPRSSKYTGVRWHKHAKSWQGQITFNKRTIHLGLYTTEGRAAQAYQAALSIVNDTSLSDSEKTDKIKTIKNKKNNQINLQM
jgi:hypothetical protein